MSSSSDCYQFTFECDVRHLVAWSLQPVVVNEDRSIQHAAEADHARRAAHTRPLCDYITVKPVPPFSAILVQLRARGMQTE